MLSPLLHRFEVALYTLNGFNSFILSSSLVRTIVYSTWATVALMYQRLQFILVCSKYIGGFSIDVIIVPQFQLYLSIPSWTVDNVSCAVYIYIFVYKQYCKYCFVQIFLITPAEQGDQ